LNFGEKVYNPLSLEEKIMAFWHNNKIYEKVKSLRANGKKFYFLDGPPYVTGYIHLGTAWNKTLKDVYLRYYRMLGYNVRDQPGWDMHGLPIEVLVEKELNLKHKGEIEEKIGVERFIKECKKFALKNLKIMENQFKRLGVWMDWEKPYRTIDREYMESEWWTFKRAWERGLLEKDYRVVHWCPRCQTALAEHEIEYKILEDPSIYVKFPVKNRENEYVLIWTTTPWTLPANLAVMVHPDYDYVKIRVLVNGREEYYWVAKGRLEGFLNEVGLKNVEVVEKVKGEELAGLRYVYPLMDEMPKHKEFEEKYENVHTLVSAEYVTLTEGTGFVHSAPGHGEEDYEVGKMYNLPPYAPIDNEGKFIEGKWAGLFVKEADKYIIETLREKGYLVWSGKVSHRYPTCWRCKSPLLFRATEQWFLRVSKIKDDILRENEENVEWLPKWVKKRYEDGVRNVGDWCVSRQRYWNTPMPIWECEKCGNVTVIGSLDELREKSKEPLPEEFDLHRPWVDKVVLKCDKCGGDMKRIPDVLDVWIDSGVAGWASLSYPKRKKEFEELWPADFVLEGQDQVLKWFYSQQVMSVVAFGTVPYKKVAMHGFVLDAAGSKMSKSLGNIVMPEDVINKYGADTLRLYLLWTTTPWEDIRFNWTGVKDIRNTLDTLWNVYILAKTYMELDNFELSKVNQEVLNSLKLEDRWIISRVNSLIRRVEEGLKEFHLARSVRALVEFILEDLSRWYGKVVRRRLWIESDDPEKLAAYWTFYKVFEKLLALLAPFTPFISEALYQSLIRKLNKDLPESVHMLDWPKVEEVDETLEKYMDIIRDISTAAASARQKANLKLRWPIREVIIDTDSKDVEEAVRALRYLLLDVLNTKDVRVARVDKIVIAVPQKSALGKKFKKDSVKVIKFLTQLEDASELKEKIEKFGEAEIDIEGEKFTIDREDVKFDLLIPENLVWEEIRNGYVFINKHRDEELVSEGFARDVVRRIQEMRKRMNLDIEEFIKLSIKLGENEKKMLTRWEDYVKRETRAKIIEFGEPKGFIMEWNVDGSKIVIGIERIE